MKNSNLPSNSDQLSAIPQLIMEMSKKSQNSAESGAFASLSPKFSLAAKSSKQGSSEEGPSREQGSSEEGPSREQISSTGEKLVIGLNSSIWPFFTFPNIIFLAGIVLVLQGINYKRQKIVAPESPRDVKKQSIPKEQELFDHDKGLDTEEALSIEEKIALFRATLSDDQFLDFYKYKYSVGFSKITIAYSPEQEAAFIHKERSGTFFLMCEKINQLSKEIYCIVGPNLDHPAVDLASPEQLEFLVKYNQYMKKIFEVFNTPVDSDNRMTLSALSATNDKMRECLEEAEFMIVNLTRWRNFVRNINSGAEKNL